MPEENDNRPPVALEQRGVSADQRMFSPSAARNMEPILAVLKRVLPTRGVVLEIGCGTGEHAVCFAEAMPNLTWQPSDPDADARASTASWIKFTGLNNVLAPLDIDVGSRLWGVEQKAPFDAIVSINMIHIAPWAASLGIVCRRWPFAPRWWASCSLRPIHARRLAHRPLERRFRRVSKGAQPILGCA